MSRERQPARLWYSCTARRPAHTVRLCSIRGYLPVQHARRRLRADRRGVRGQRPDGDRRLPGQTGRVDCLVPHPLGRSRRVGTSAIGATAAGRATCCPGRRGLRCWAGIGRDHWDAGPFATRPGQSLQDQIDVLGSLVNRLRNEVISEPRERERAISAERAARRNELKAEAERLERLIAALRQEVERLDEATTGNLGLRAEGLWWLVAGIVFTTWSELSWLPFRLTAFVVGTIFVARVSWPYWSWLARSQAGRPARRVGCGVLWRG